MILTAEVDVVFSKPTSLKTHNLHFFFTQHSYNDTTGEMQWCVCSVSPQQNLWYWRTFLPVKVGKKKKYDVMRYLIEVITL